MYRTLVKLNEWLSTKMGENLAEMNEVSIYEVSCQQLNKQLINGQAEVQKRLARFIEKHIETINKECEKFYHQTIAKLSVPMSSIDDFATQKENLVEISGTIPRITEHITLMGLMGELLPNLKNITLKKGVEKTIALSAQGAQLLTTVEDQCSSSVDKFEKEYKELEKKMNRQFEDLITDVTDKKWLS